MPAAIPHIELGGELGRGAQGIVVRGVRDGHVYAVKLPLSRGDAADRDAIYRRFVREAVALARLRHPSLPRVMEVGRTGGVPYLVMELAPGETLAERLERRGPLGDSEATSLARQLLGAIGAIHAAGLLHRDVTPRNVVFDPETGQARLVDLGSAVLARGSRADEGARVHATPEVLDEAFGAVDARADLFSLGCVLSEAIGQPAASTVRETSRSRRSDDGALAPAPLAAVLARLVASRPEDSYASAASALEDLERADGGTSDGSTASASGRVPRSRLVGRDAELAQLRLAWGRIHEGGSIVVLRGESGTGKSRLARAFLDECASVDPHVRVLAAACHPRDPRAFAAIRQIVEAYIRACERLPAAERTLAFSDLRALADDVGVPLGLLSPRVAAVFRGARPTAPSPENAEEAFAEGLSEFIVKLLHAWGPAIVFVDDVQWLDAASRRVLSRAASQASSGRVLFLFGARDGASVQLSRLLEGVETAAPELDLARLTDDETIELVRDYLGAPGIDPGLRHAVLRLSDGNPLRALEVLRSLLDEGILLPHWGRWKLDANALAAMHLPSEAVSLLGRRIDALDPATRSMLRIAAVVGMTFEDALVAPPSTGTQAVASGLIEACRMQLVEPFGDASHRFVHHVVREALLDECDPSELAERNQAIAEALDAQPELLSAPRAPASDALDAAVPDADALYRVAHHYAGGVSGKTPGRVAETCVAAGRAAFLRFDNERATEFLIAADTALALVGASLPPEARLLLADARLRAGSAEEALRDFERVLADSHDPYEQAFVLLRISQLHDLQCDTVRAWDFIARAFQKIGEPVPEESPRYALGSLALWASRGVGAAQRRAEGPAEQRRCEVLCALYFHGARVAVTAGKPLRVVFCAGRSVRTAERLGPSPSLAKSYLAYSFVLTMLGARARGARYLERAEAIARDIRDPVAYSHALQVHMVISAWGGKVQDALDAARRCLHDYGHWRELGEFCMSAHSAALLETVRGRDVEGWRWIELVVERVNRHDGAPVVHEILLLMARAQLAALGRDHEIAGRLRRLEQVSVPIPKDSALYASTFVPRLRVFTDRMNLGPAFEALVSEFRALGLRPGNVHLTVVEYYVLLAHARVHACLRAEPEARAPLIEALRSALSDLEATRKFPPAQAHARVIQGYHHWFSGRDRDAQQAFDDAERLGRVEDAPWVLYAVHRGRAHILRSEDRLDAAKDQAALAEFVAMAHGSVHRARIVREEFGLDAVGKHTASDASVSRPTDSGYETATSVAARAPGSRRQLKALLRISQARTRELSPDHEARLVVDELVDAFRADRGFLFLSDDDAAGERRSLHDAESQGRFEFVVGRDADGRDLRAVDPDDRDAIRRLWSASAGETPDVGAPGVRVVTTARRCTMVAPLVVDDVMAGIASVDRPLSHGIYTDADADVFSALAGQVAITLELGRTLRARERAQESLRDVEKMDAVARFSRTIAHDTNNLLYVIRLAAERMTLVRGAEHLVGPQIQVVQSALTRAEELMRQLGTFSPSELGARELVPLRRRIELLLPVIVGLAGDSIHVEASLDRSEAPILIDPHRIDQAIMNLAINARDAMPSGGRLAFEIDEVELDTEQHPTAKPGRYVRLTVTDSGHGMNDEVRRQIFEPYFTTKKDRGGAGLGLSTVYWIVAQSGGHIDVRSEEGIGTVFILHFPAALGSAG